MTDESSSNRKTRNAKESTETTADRAAMSREERTFSGKISKSIWRDYGRWKKTTDGCVSRQVDSCARGQYEGDCVRVRIYMYVYVCVRPDKIINNNLMLQ